MIIKPIYIDSPRSDNPIPDRNKKKIDTQCCFNLQETIEKIICIVFNSVYKQNRKKHFKVNVRIKYLFRISRGPWKS